MRTIMIDIGIELHRHHAFRVLRRWPIGRWLLTLGKFMGGRTWYFLATASADPSIRPCVRMPIRKDALKLMALEAWVRQTGVAIPSGAWSLFRDLRDLAGEFPDVHVIVPRRTALPFWPDGSLAPMPRIIAKMFAQRIPRVARLPYVAIPPEDVRELARSAPDPATRLLAWRFERLEFLLSHGPTRIWLARRNLGYLVFEFAQHGAAVADTPDYGRAAYIAPLADWRSLFQLSPSDLRQDRRVRRIPHGYLWQRQVQRILMPPPPPAMPNASLESTP